MPLPHEGVYVRLGVSTVPGAGIGVFAIRDILRRTIVCRGSEDPLMRYQEEKLHLEELPAEVRKLYEDFCVFEDGEVVCPVSLDRLTPDWYFNNSDNPNVACDEKFDFVALRDIKKGEELFSRYDDYSDR